MKLWKGDLASVNQAVADSLADPASYPDLFPNFDLTLAAETAFKQKRQSAPTPAGKYAEVKAFQDELNVLEKIQELQPAGFLQLLARGPADNAAAPAPAPAPAPVAAPESAPAVQAPPPEVAAAAPAPVPEVTEAAAPEATVPEAAETVDEGF